MASKRRPSGEFLHTPLAEGLDLHVRTTQRFKTISLQAVLASELGADATKLALLSMLLKRGTRRLPSHQAQTRFLENLYGAGFDVDVQKRGEFHLLVARLSHPAPAFVDEGETLLEESLRFLGECLSDPRLVNGVFPADVVEQEKTNLRRAIQSLVNHREQYALEKLIRTMCRGERFAVYEYGRLEDLDDASPAALHRFQRRLLRTRPLTLLACGAVDPDRLAALAETHLGWTRDTIEVPPVAERRRAPAAPRREEEAFPMEQEWIVRGYRIDADVPGPDDAALLFFNGILGGFAFSRLFKQIREHEGLAYDIGSHTERLKGLLLVSAGVQPGSADKVLSRIDGIVEDLRGGNVTAEEMEGARNRLLAEVRSLHDSPEMMIASHKSGLLAGRVRTVAEMEEAIRAVAPGDVTRLASSLRLDTTFLLRPARTGGS